MMCFTKLIQILMQTFCWSFLFVASIAIKNGIAFMLFLSVFIVLVSISETNTKYDTKRDIQNNEQIWKYTRITHSFWKENKEELIYISCFFLLCLIIIFLFLGCLKTKYGQIFISWCYQNFINTQVHTNYPLSRDNNYQQTRYRNNRIYWNDNALQYQPSEDI